MILPLFIREIARDLAARKALSAYLVELGRPPARPFESLTSLRERYRDALVRKAEDDALAACERWEGQIDGDTCPDCGAPALMHPSRCEPEPDGTSNFDPFEYDYSGKDACDGCGRTRAEHEPGAKPTADAKAW